MGGRVVVTGCFVGVGVSAGENVIQSPEQFLIHRLLFLLHPVSATHVLPSVEQHSIVWRWRWSLMEGSTRRLLLLLRASEKTVLSVNTAKRKAYRATDKKAFMVGMRVDECRCRIVRVIVMEEG